MKKLPVFLFNGLLVMMLLLAACAPAATQTEPAAAVVEEATATTAPEPTTEPVEAPTATTPPEPTPLPPVELTWYLIGNGQPAGTEEVMAALNELPQMQAINTKLNIVVYGWGDYDQKVQLMFSGNEECDLVFTSGWANPYINGSLNGNFIALDDLLPQYAPNTWAQMPAAAWTMSKVDGKIYAIPNQQIWYNSYGVLTRKELAEKYGLDLANVNTYADLTPYLAALKAGEPQLGDKLVSDLLGVTGTTSGEVAGYEVVNGVIDGAMIKAGDTNRTIVDYYQTDAYRQAMDLLHSWSVAGYLPKEAAGFNDLIAQRQNGFFPVFLHIAKPGNDGELATSAGGEWIMKNLTQHLYLSGVTSTLTAVCASSKNPERAVMFLDLMNTDPVVYNMVAKGLEGKSWIWVDEANKVIGFPEGVDASNSPYYLNIDWELGNQFNAYYTNPKQVGAWEATAQGNQEAALPLAGPFIFDPTPVQAEIAACGTATSQFDNLTKLGAVDPSDAEQGLAAFIAARQACGVDKIIAEAQNQLNAFMAKYPEFYK